MKAPAFWYQPRGALATVLSPLGWIYGEVGKVLRGCKRPRSFSVPIISIGNLVVGGAGKTPTALALAVLLQKKGLTVHFVTRGYGGKLRGPVKVDFSRHTAQEVGDEALLLAQQAPTWVGKKRVLAIQKACEEEPDLIILDDGHQTSGVYKDISFVVIDQLQEFGNGCVVPAGPLRESLGEGFRRADAIVSIETGNKKQGSKVRKFISSGLSQFNAHLIPSPLPSSLSCVVAFCGLGFPQKFFKTLEGLDIKLAAFTSFPDHHFYTDDDLCHLDALSQTHQASLLTTRKDWVKLPLTWQKKVHVLDVALHFDDADKLYDFIFQKDSRFGALV